jgi:hypothetical protein
MGLRNLNFHHWPVFLALLMLAFGPALAPVLSLSKNRTIEICTGFGLVKIAVAGDQSPVPEHNKDQKQQAGHCVFCNVRKFMAAALVPQSLSLPLLFSVAYVWPDMVRDGAKTISPIAAYHSRAPPLLTV